MGELLADDAQVVGRFEVGNPVVEETDTMWLAQPIQFVEPDGSLAQALSEVLEEELEPAWRVQLDDACRLGPRVPHGVGDTARLKDPAAGRRLDDLLADPSVHLPLEHVEPDIVFMYVAKPTEELPPPGAVAAAPPLGRSMPGSGTDQVQRPDRGRTSANPTSASPSIFSARSPPSSGFSPGPASPRPRRRRRSAERDGDVQLEVIPVSPGDSKVPGIDNDETCRLEWRCVSGSYAHIMGRSYRCDIGVGLTHGAAGALRFHQQLSVELRGR